MRSSGVLTTRLSGRLRSLTSWSRRRRQRRRRLARERGRHGHRSCAVHRPWLACGGHAERPVRRPDRCIQRPGPIALRHVILVRLRRRATRAGLARSRCPPAPAAWASRSWSYTPGRERVLDQVGGRSHLAHRLVEHVAELGLEARAHPPQLAVEAPGAPDGVGQLVRPEHDQGDDQDGDQLTATDVEHGQESTEASRAQTAQGGRLLERRQGPASPRHGSGGRGAAGMISACSSGSQASSCRLSASPIEAPGRTPGRTPSRPSSWPCGWAPPAWRATSGSPPTAWPCSTTTACSAASSAASRSAPTSRGGPPGPHPHPGRAVRHLWHRLPPLARPEARRGRRGRDPHRPGRGPGPAPSALAVPSGLAGGGRAAPARRRT